MEKVKKAVGIAVSWFGVFWFLIFTIVSFPSFGTVIFLIGLTICLPIQATRNFWNEKGPHGAGKIALIVALIIAGAAMSPRKATETPSNASEVVEVEESAPEINDAQSQTENVPESEQTQEVTEPNSVSEASPVEEEPEPEGKSIILSTGWPSTYSESAKVNGEKVDLHYIPNGVYYVKNLDKRNPIEVSVYHDTVKNADGEYEYAEVGDSAQLDARAYTEITVPIGWFVVIQNQRLISSEVKFIRTGDLPELDSSMGEPPDDLTGMDKTKYNLRKIVSRYYVDTVVDEIRLNENLGTDSDGDYVALIDLTWNGWNSARTTKKTIKSYSEDFATRIANSVPEVTDVAMFWMIPRYPGIGDMPSAKYSYEIHGSSLRQTDEMWNRAVSDE